MKRALAMRLPILFASMGAVLMSGHAISAMVVVVLIVAFSLAGPKLLLTARMEWVLALAALVASVFVSMTPTPATDVFGQPGLTQGWRVLVLLGLFVTGFRVAAKSPWGGEITTIGVSLFPVMGLGGGQAHPVYPAFVVVYCASLLFGAWVSDRSRPSLAQLGLARASVTLVALLGATAGGVAIAKALPTLHDRAQDYVVDLLALDASRLRSGFSTNLELGGMQSMLESDAKVFRISGPTPDHLRGVVYTTYRQGEWYTPRSRNMRTLPSVGAGENSTYVEVVGAERDRLFVPIGAGGVGSGTQVSADHMGILRSKREELEAYWFAGAAPQHIAVAPPDEHDLRVPRALEPHLRRIAATITSPPAA